jgi:hypothetical protein
LNPEPDPLVRGADPYPHRNVRDPQHIPKEFLLFIYLNFPTSVMKAGQDFAQASTTANACRASLSYAKHSIKTIFVAQSLNKICFCCAPTCGDCILCERSLHAMVAPSSRINSLVKMKRKELVRLLGCCC